jgi:hypothetical protein
MATARKKVVTVVLESPQEKKNTVRYDAADKAADSAMSTAYISKKALGQIGNPEKIKITIEAA